jgi:hypothetical protein
MPILPFCGTYELKTRETPKAWLRRFLGPPKTDGTVTLQLEADTSGDIRRRVLEAVKIRGPGVRLLSLSLSGGLSKITIGYTDLDVARVEALETALREISPAVKINIVFDRIGPAV